MQPGYNYGPGYPQAGYPQPQPGYPQAGYPPQQGYQAPPTAGFNVGGLFGGAPPPQSAPYGDGTGETGGDEFSGMAAFSSKAVRLGFIRKVYSILSAQLVVTFGFVLIFVLNEDTKYWAAKNIGLLYLAFGVGIVSMLTLACCGNVRRKFPMNFVCLGIFTLAQSFMLGFITAFYKTQIVMLAVAMTAVVCIGLTIFAMQVSGGATEA